MEIKKIGIVGAGQMGNGIAHVAAQAGLDVILLDVTQENLDRAVATITKNLDRMVAKEKISEADKEAVLANITTATDYATFKDCQLVVEAATENESIKEKISINRGKIEASIDGQVKDIPWLFVGGDILRGPDLIGGVSDGHRAAKAIDAYLYENAKKKDISDSLKAMREAVKESSPELTIRQGGKK